MRVLCLGGTGFLGSALAEHYRQKGHCVKTLGRGEHGAPDIVMTKESIDTEVVNQDLIIDCASTVNDYGLLDGSYDDVDTNVLGTQVLLEACRKYNPWARIVYVSTFFVVGDPPFLPADESTVCRPKGAYGATKLCAEHLCQAYARVFDLNVSIVRGTNIYGPGQKVASQQTAAFNWMIWTCVENGVVPLYDFGHVKRDYLYIDDAVSAIAAVASCGEKGECYFFGSGEPMSFRDMVCAMQFAAEGGSVLEVPSPGFHKRVGIGNFWIDNSKMRSIGWEPTVPIVEGIRRTVEWYRGQ